MIPGHQLATYVRLLERRARLAGRSIRFALAVGNICATFTRDIDGVCFAYVILSSGDMYTMPCHEHPDPRHVGNLLTELKSATATGELEALRDELAAVADGSDAEAAKNLN